MTWNALSVCLSHILFANYLFVISIFFFLGEVDEMLMAAIDMPRCGMPDNVPEDYRVSSVKYGSPELTYRIDSFTPDMAQEDVRMILRSALQVSVTCKYV